MRGPGPGSGFPPPFPHGQGCMMGLATFDAMFKLTIAPMEMQHGFNVTFHDPPAADVTRPVISWSQGFDLAFEGINSKDTEVLTLLVDRAVWGSTLRGKEISSGPFRYTIVETTTGEQTVNLICHRTLSRRVGAHGRGDGGG